MRTLISIWIGSLLLCGAAETPRYCDGRPAAKYRLDALDQGVVLRHKGGPGQCDDFGARDIWVFQEGNTFYLHYDGAGPQGWLTCLATSKDLVHWEKKGPVLELGQPGEPDSASASYGVTFKAGKFWHMFYLGTPNVTPPPGRVPMFPYQTLKAKSRTPAGPWIKQKSVIPFRCQPGAFYSVTASPGCVLKHRSEYLLFFSGATDNPVKRTIGLARTKDLDAAWTIDLQPVFSPEEQVENTSIYYEPKCRTWFLFTNHIGIDERGEYTDAVWVYWSKDLTHWDARKKAVVLDRKNCAWSKDCIGLPSVIKCKNRLAVLYDAPGGTSIDHLYRDVGLAWLNLPLVPPDQTTNE